MTGNTVQNAAYTIAFSSTTQNWPPTLKISESFLSHCIQQKYAITWTPQPLDGRKGVHTRNLQWKLPSTAGSICLHRRFPNGGYATSYLLNKTFVVMGSGIGVASLTIPPRHTSQLVQRAGQFQANSSALLDTPLQHVPCAHPLSCNTKSALYLACFTKAMVGERLECCCQRHASGALILATRNYSQHGTAVPSVNLQ